MNKIQHAWTERKARKGKNMRQRTKQTEKGEAASRDSDRLRYTTGKQAKHTKTAEMNGNKWQ